MTRFATALGRVGAAAALVVAATLSGATAAAAAPAVPDDCTSQLYSTGARAYCGGGTGSYRASVRCDKNNRPDYNRQGAWVQPGRWSFADCNAGDRPFNAGLERRS